LRGSVSASRHWRVVEEGERWSCSVVSSSRTNGGSDRRDIASLSSLGTPLNELEIYATVGEDGFRRLVAAFYRQVPGDDILGPMYPPDDMDGAEERLRDFLIGRFGGPQRYIERRGHPRLRMRHMPFPIDLAARDRWVELMDNAMEEAEFPEEVKGALKPFFGAVADMMVNKR
jgi:hemoglobin